MAGKKKYLDEDGLRYYDTLMRGKIDLKADAADLDALEDKVDDMIAEGGEPNVIEKVKVNGTALVPDATKAVDVTVPTTVAELTDADDYAKKSDVTSAVKYKGTVATYAALPSANRAVGDLYNVEQADATHGVRAGDNVVWNGTAWDVQSGTVDLSDYVLESDLEAITNSEIDSIVEGA